MKPLAELDPRDVRYVLADIDDTLTTAGKLTAQAYAALESLSRAGKKVVVVTGRPAGWCDHIARMWPVDAVVGENGAFYFWFADGKLGKRFVDGEPTRARHRRALEVIAARILQKVPGTALASGPGLPGDRPRHRLLRGRCAAFARGRADGKDLLDPCQRLVRAL